MDAQLTIREFRSSDAVPFRSLNEAWIERYFALEPKDREVLERPEEKILALGGKILIAEFGGGLGAEVVGCCALVPRGSRLATGQGYREYELAKMTVREDARGRGVGAALVQSALEMAREAGATQLYLESNSKLSTAVRLYERMGFTHVPAERRRVTPYARADVQMELKL